MENSWQLVVSLSVLIYMKLSPYFDNNDDAPENLYVDDFPTCLTPLSEFFGKHQCPVLRYTPRYLYQDDFPTCIAPWSEFHWKHQCPAPISSEGADTSSIFGLDFDLDIDVVLNTGSILLVIGHFALHEYMASSTSTLSNIVNVVATVSSLFVSSTKFSWEGYATTEKTDESFWSVLDLSTVSPSAIFTEWSFRDFCFAIIFCSSAVRSLVFTVVSVKHGVHVLNKVTSNYWDDVREEERRRKIETAAPKQPEPKPDQRIPSYWKSYEDIQLHPSPDQVWSSYLQVIDLSSQEHQKEMEAVVDLVNTQQQAHLTGYGSDARNLGHRMIVVTNVHRIENLPVWRRYHEERERLLGMGIYSILPVRNMPNCRNLQQNGVNASLNECYLFHGTKHHVVDSIITNGLDTQYASSGGLHGAGIYFAESPTKSDQYADSKHSRISGDQEFCMLVTRVILGNAYINTHSNPVKYTHPPSQHHSVVDDAGRLFREFVIYNSSQCYPEYVVRYRRV